jgi:hypothetical protein
MLGYDWDPLGYKWRYEGDFPEISYSNNFYYGKFSGNKKIIGYGERIYNVSDDWEEYLSGEFIDGWWYYSRTLESTNYQFAINMSGFDSTTVSNLNNTITRLCGADPSCYIESRGSDSTLFLRLITTDSMRLFKGNSKGDYIDYFGLFTRNLRVKRFD